ncbi:GntR family transcriptional regulator [Paenarthrobacter sp. NPDC056912]|uniref:GntR family transcriptional regulator n=1 Tax=Paenarthrobacter sp. NPDC056912 TaxID=3345965 RepID=UPI00367251BD
MPSTLSRAQIALDHLRKLIATGEPGDRLPSEAELATRIGVSRVTVREALNRLWHEGAVVRRWGAGTYIAEPPAAEDEPVFRSIYVDINTVGSLPDEIARTGRKPGLAAFSVSQAPAPAWIKRESGFSGDLWRVGRCIAIDGIPAVLIEDFLPLQIAGNTVDPHRLSDLSMDITTFIRQAGVRVVKHEAILDAVLADKDTGTALDVPEGSPLLRAKQRAISESGETITCTEVRYRAEIIGQVLIRTVAE